MNFPWRARDQLNFYFKKDFKMYFLIKNRLFLQVCVDSLVTYS